MQFGRIPSRQQGDDRHAKGVEVGGGFRMPPKLLRCHVPEGAGNGASTQGRSRERIPDGSKVHEHHPSIRTAPEVPGLQVPMDDRWMARVQVIEDSTDLIDQVQSLGFRPAVSCQFLVESDTLHELLDEEQRTPPTASRNDLVQPARNPWVGQLAKHPPLPFHEFPCLGIISQTEAISLTATEAPVCSSVPRYTVPDAPWPTTTPRR